VASVVDPHHRPRHGIRDGRALQLRGVAFLSAFAAGAVVTMLASTMAPEAARVGGPVSGLVTTGGFLLAVMLDYVT
jgi:zinc transporter ZupT